MAEPARKLEPDTDFTLRPVQQPERGRVIPLHPPGAHPAEDEVWVLRAIMACYCLGDGGSSAQ